MNETSTFQQLTGKSDHSDFIVNNWEKRAFVFPASKDYWFKDIVTVESFIAHEVFHCGSIKAACRDQRGWLRETKIKPSEANKYFSEGQTICATALAYDGGIRTLIKKFESAFNTPTPVHVNGYYSPHRSGYNVHFDTHPVWLFQLSGQKNWKVGRQPIISNPVTNVVFPPDREILSLPWITLKAPDINNDETFFEHTLQPGEILYIPAGTWHAAEAIEHSFALTLANPRGSTAQLVLELLRSVSSSNPSLNFLPGIPSVPNFESQADNEISQKIKHDLAIMNKITSSLSEEHILEFIAELSSEPDLRQRLTPAGDAKQQAKMLKQRDK